MTEEQIKQNALAYAIENYGEYDEHDYTDHSGSNMCHAVSEKAFIAGAHSRDEEMKQLRNPWISVKDRLPETGEDIIYLMNSGTPGRNERYRKFDAEWFRMNVRYWQYTNDPE